VLNALTVFIGHFLPISRWCSRRMQPAAVASLPRLVAASAVELCGTLCPARHSRPRAVGRSESLTKVYTWSVKDIGLGAFGAPGRMPARSCKVLKELDGAFAIA
jgi:hypothetical protein